MSREILFRGKRKDNKLWVEGSLFNAATGLTVIENGGNKREDFHFVIPETVGQYIERIDKNNKKIFKGNILKIPCELYSASNWYQKTNKRNRKTT